MEKILNIEGMSCQNCVKHVTNALKSIDGVDTVEVSLESKQAVVTSHHEIQSEALEKAVEEAGYRVK